MRSKIVAGNWKMNCNREEAFALGTEIRDMLADETMNKVKVILAPPFVHIASIVSLLSGSAIEVAAQNCASEKHGAFTGEVSASMLKSVGTGYVIIGHSERRSLFNESNEDLLKKLKEVLSNNLIPIFCVGESLSVRESGKQDEIIQQQLENTIFKLDPLPAGAFVIAYEPVWAIGTGKTASTDQVSNMHAFIRNLFSSKWGKSVAENISILYGGSCNENNAKELFSIPDVDGGLIGGASLKSRSFVNIVKSF